MNPVLKNVNTIMIELTTDLAEYELLNNHYKPLLSAKDVSDLEKRLQKIRDRIICNSKSLASWTDSVHTSYERIGIFASNKNKQASVFNKIEKDTYITHKRDDGFEFKLKVNNDDIDDIFAVLNNGSFVYVRAIYTIGTSSDCIGFIDESGNSMSKDSTTIYIPCFLKQHLATTRYYIHTNPDTSNKKDVDRLQVIDVKSKVVGYVGKDMIMYTSRYGYNDPIGTLEYEFGNNDIFKVYDELMNIHAGFGKKRSTFGSKDKESTGFGKKASLFGLGGEGRTWTPPSGFGSKSKESSGSGGASIGVSPERRHMTTSDSEKESSLLDRHEWLMSSIDTTDSWTSLSTMLSLIQDKDSWIKLNTHTSGNLKKIVSKMLTTAMKNINANENHVALSNKHTYIEVLESMMIKSIRSLINKAHLYSSSEYKIIWEMIRREINTLNEVYTHSQCVTTDDLKSDTIIEDEDIGVIIITMVSNFIKTIVDLGDTETSYLEKQRCFDYVAVLDAFEEIEMYPYIEEIINNFKSKPHGFN